MHFREWKSHILIKISLKFVPKGPNDNDYALVQIMGWWRVGTIIWTNAESIHDPINAALGGVELNDVF